ncbi:PREDICTED: uncharacterized protein LOC108373253 [Rhagoletis zephyria]|uniref:uncharacterized protein LOC108373253 n=1 Tax=Rhagoletis zephyria TaxID=28612 RepID=UPI00081198AA|nr:PREDICTED: uncharacterized protein LOC108373253 [Rhagoletis zephyria]
MVVQNSNKICEITLCSLDLGQKITTCAILPQLTHFLPTSKVSNVNIDELHSLQLADPNCFIPSKIDMVIGSDITPQILLDGLQRNIDGTLVAQNTIFGWILSDPVREHISTFSTHVTEATEPELSTLIKRFWEQEEIETAQPKSAEDEFCEELYRTTTARREDGRYVVKLPFKPEFPDALALGHSRPAAQQQYISIEDSG